MAGMTAWATREGSPNPLGATWIPGEQAYNFALYSNRASRVTLLFYAPNDLVRPSFTYLCSAKISGPIIWSL